MKRMKSSGKGPKKFFGKHPKTKMQRRGKMHTVMGEFKRGQLHSGSKHGPEVKSRKQAIAIGLNQAGLSKYGKGRSKGRSRRGGTKR